MGKIRRGDMPPPPPPDPGGRVDPAQFFRREFDIDVVATYERLKTIATLPVNDLQDRMALSRAINTAAQNAYDANRIFLKAKRERQLFKIEFARETRDLNRAAVTAIDQWMKNNDVKSKQITKDMIEQELASNPTFVDRYRGLMVKLEDLREVRDNCKSLAEQWSERKGLFQTQARLLTQEKEILFGNRGEDGTIGYRTRGPEDDGRRAP